MPGTFIDTTMSITKLASNLRTNDQAVCVIVSNDTFVLMLHRDGGEGIARMCIRLVSKPASQAEQASSSYDNKLFEVSKSKLLDGVEKTKLINIMSSLEHLVPLM